MSRLAKVTNPFCIYAMLGLVWGGMLSGIPAKNFNHFVYLHLLVF